MIACAACPMTRLTTKLKRQGMPTTSPFLRRKREAHPRIGSRTTSSRIRAVTNPRKSRERPGWFRDAERSAVGSAPLRVAAKQNLSAILQGLLSMELPTLSRVLVTALLSLLSMACWCAAAAPATRPVAHPVEEKARKLLDDWKARFDEEHFHAVVAGPWVIAGNGSAAQIARYRDQTVLAAAKSLHAQ